MNRMGSSYGIKFGDLKRMPNSYNALEAAEYAKSIGKGHEYHEALMQAYFTDVMDISDIQVLGQVGEGVGIRKTDLVESVLEKRFSDILEKNTQYARSQGIRSTPTFIINDEYRIVGAQPIENFRKILDSLGK